MTIAAAIYVALGIAFAIDAGAAIRSADRWPWYADAAGFCVVALCWGPIVVAVIACHLLECDR